MAQHIDPQPCRRPKHLCLFCTHDAAFWSHLSSTTRPSSACRPTSRRHLTSRQWDLHLVRSRELCPKLVMTLTRSDMPIQSAIAHINITLTNCSSINNCHTWLQGFIWLHLHTVPTCFILPPSSSPWLQPFQAPWARPSQLTRRLPCHAAACSLTCPQLKL